MTLSFSVHIYNLIISIHTRTHFFNMIRSDVFIVFHHLVNDTIRGQFNNTVRHRFNKFVVVGREQHISLISLQIIIESLN